MLHAPFNATGAHKQAGKKSRPLSSGLWTNSADKASLFAQDALKIIGINDLTNKGNKISSRRIKLHVAVENLPLLPIFIREMNGRKLALQSRAGKKGLKSAMSHYGKDMPVFFPARRPYFAIPDFCRVTPATEKCSLHCTFMR